ncbi:MAG: GIY-YIG nuclease family protein [Bacteroidetes bacterium]|nr:GIY-YIG nuclease family protein [Bacteroidota bacterium]
MPFYVYIIQSLVDGTIYKASSTNPMNRLKMHNAGFSRYTKAKLPCKILYIEQLNSKAEMLIREKNMNKQKHNH